MLTHLPRFRLPVLMRPVVACLMLAGLCGCATVLFKSTREARFIDMDGNSVHVSYGKEKRTTTLPNGLVCTFEGKVRLKLPDGKRIVLYQTLSASGVRYATKDKQYDFIEQGPYCVVLHGGAMFFEGVYCRSK